MTLPKRSHVNRQFLRQHLTALNRKLLHYNVCARADSLSLCLHNHIDSLCCIYGPPNAWLCQCHGGQREVLIYHSTDVDILQLLHVVL